MALSPGDQQGLLVPLVDGLHESPPWTLFVHNLRERTGGLHACLVTRAGAGQKQRLVAAAPPRTPALDLPRLEGLGLQPLATLRPGRVYGLDEMLAYGEPERLAVQRDALDRTGLHHGRWLRVSAGSADAWLILLREREDFSATATAILTALVPHLAAALRTLAVLEAERLQAGMANAALNRLGLGQIAFDQNGGVIAADPLATEVLPLLPPPDPRSTPRLALRPAAAATLEQACAKLAADPEAGLGMVELDAGRGLWLLLRPARLPDPAASPAVIGTVRIERREPMRPGAEVLRAVHGLSEREAMLAELLSRGQSIAEAARELHLTEETARNYSKRIYARTATRGQGDLVRRVLTGLAPLA